MLLSVSMHHCGQSVSTSKLSGEFLYLPELMWFRADVLRSILYSPNCSFWPLPALLPQNLHHEVSWSQFALAELDLLLSRSSSFRFPGFRNLTRYESTEIHEGSRCTVSGENAWIHTAMYSAPSGPGVLYRTHSLR